MLKTPTVQQARPARCPRCGAASCPLGGQIQLQGHGLRERQVLGPQSPDDTPTEETLMGRRYRCIVCTAVITVVPCEIRARWQYSAAAISFALALWGLALATASEVRKRISPRPKHGASGIVNWKTLRRWACAVKEKRLFPSTLIPPEATSLRKLAAAAAITSAAQALPSTRGLPIEHRAFLGAAQAA